MSADEEVRQDRLAGPSTATVLGVCMTGEEGCLDGYLLDCRDRREHGAKLLKSWEAGRDLGEDDGVEDDRAVLSSVLCLDSSRTRLIGGRLPIPLWFLVVL